MRGVIALTVLAASSAAQGQTLPVWTDIEPDLRALATAHPDLVRMVSLGRSRQARDIWALRITAHPDIDEDEPEVRLVGAHHGNETMGVEICLRAAHMIAEGEADPRIAAILASREVWIVPVVNPDGFVANRRENAAGIDINRNYGFMWNGFGASPYSEPEPRALRDHAMTHPFVLSYTFHTDARYVNYVWNYTTRVSPDDALIRALATRYGAASGYTPVEGANWYVIMGDLNDFSYGCRGDVDTTIETSAVDPEGTWALNREPILASIEAAGTGLRGVVTDAETGAPLEAMVWVEEADWPVFTDPSVGDFHRMLLPGTYTVRVVAAGHATSRHTGVVVAAGDAARLDVRLVPGGATYAWNVSTVRFVRGLDARGPGATEPPWMLGPPDGRMFRMGARGYVVVDFGGGAPAEDPAHVGIQVHGAASGRGRVEISADLTGPWTLLGEVDGDGVVGPSASASGARYVRLTDLGTVTGGFAVDAVERVRVDSPVEPVDGTDAARAEDASDDLVMRADVARDDSVDGSTPATPRPGCGCRVAGRGRTSRGHALAAGLFLGLALGRRARRRRRRT